MNGDRIEEEIFNGTNGKQLGVGITPLPTGVHATPSMARLKRVCGAEMKVNVASEGNAARQISDHP